MAIENPSKIYRNVVGNRRSRAGLIPVAGAAVTVRVGGSRQDFVTMIPDGGADTNFGVSRNSSDNTADQNGEKGLFATRGVATVDYSFTCLGR